MLNHERPVVLSLAGFDPSGGAGILADIKVFDRLEVLGQAVITLQTIQHDSLFVSCENTLDYALSQLDILQKRVKFEFCKVGILNNLRDFELIADRLFLSSSCVKIVWDPVMQPSHGEREFHYPCHDWLKTQLLRCALWTPNQKEFCKIIQCQENEVDARVREWSVYCPILLKGGHLLDGDQVDLSRDRLYLWNGVSCDIHNYDSPRLNADKRGTGCVLSAAIVAYLAKGLELKPAIFEAKKHMGSFLLSSQTRLGVFL
jgi:hydroxymethylpyrimidine/phosphomethylpyrimidine kinase